MLYPSEWVGSLELKRNSSKSGFCGVIPAGKKWQARIYKPEKQRWDPLGTYPTAHEAAVAAATAKQKLESGQAVYSPAYKRFRRSGGTQLACRFSLPSLWLVCT
jgi:hypothetical protein